MTSPTALFSTALCCVLALGACGGNNPNAIVDAGIGDGGVVDLASFTDGAAADLAVGTDLMTTANAYDTDGPVAFTTFDLSVSGDGHNFSVHVYSPTATGAHPVVVLSPGLQQPGSAYASYGKRLASYGVVTIIRDDPGFLTGTPSVVSDLEYLVVTWLPAQNLSGMLATHLDLAHVGLAGHSRGGKATLLAAEGAAKTHVKAWAGIDPVDASPTGAEPQARTAIANVAVPLLFVGAGVSTSCSPATDNYEVLYTASVAPSLALTLVGASHTQVEESATCFACGLCTPLGTADPAKVLSQSVRYVTAFFARELLADATVGAQLDGAGAGADVTAGLITRSVK